VNEEMIPINIYVISDSVGETGANAAKAVISQFRPNFDAVKINKFPYLQTIDEIEPIVRRAKLSKASIVFTLVEKEMRQMMTKRCQELDVPAIDLLGSMIDLMEQTVQQPPLEQPGLVHQLDDYYFKKIEAIEFAVKYDDGRDPRGILLADIVLVGVSRTSKTPLSQYLANKAYKVANVPLVPEVEPPKELFEMDPKKCFGLVISTEHLNNIRKERLLALGLGEDASYAQVNRIEQEIAYFEKIVERINCHVIDVSNKAVEETANLIIEHYKKAK
jgi:[pyruvate, water dikinase]-phosphate phosphotransferase / [pyruvate, water dikinase] kinase